jgi:hypothetical protein
VNDFVTASARPWCACALALSHRAVLLRCFFVLDSRLTHRTLAVREIAEELIREAAA